LSIDNETDCTRLLTFLSLLGFIIPQRVVLSIMGFLAIVNAYTMRICLSVAITEMVVKRNYSSEGHDDIDRGVCIVDGESGNANKGGGTFEWDESLQGIILGAFFWGYVSHFRISMRISSSTPDNSRSLRTSQAASYRKSLVANTHSAWEFYRLPSSL
jgi:hypothetical protein